jgi:hypothetical protein
VEAPSGGEVGAARKKRINPEEEKLREKLLVTV